MVEPISMFSIGKRVKSHARNRNTACPLKSDLGTNLTLSMPSGRLCSNSADVSLTSPNSSHKPPPFVVNCHAPFSWSTLMTAIPNSVGTSISDIYSTRDVMGSPMEMRLSSDLVVMLRGTGCNTGASFTGRTITVTTVESELKASILESDCALMYDSDTLLSVVSQAARVTVTIPFKFSPDTKRMAIPIVASSARAKLMLTFGAI